MGFLVDHEQGLRVSVSESLTDLCFPPPCSANHNLHSPSIPAIWKCETSHSRSVPDFHFLRLSLTASHRLAQCASTPLELRQSSQVVSREGLRFIRQFGRSPNNVAGSAMPPYLVPRPETRPRRRRPESSTGHTVVSSEFAP